MKSAGGGGQEAEAAVKPKGNPAWRVGGLSHSMGHEGLFLQHCSVPRTSCVYGTVSTLDDRTKMVMSEVLTALVKQKS